jgi:AcrR family transcriptional regulator
MGSNIASSKVRAARGSGQAVRSPQTRVVGASAAGPLARSTRGRPRDHSIDREVVAAVLRALRSRGYGAVTIEGIARTVGRARTSLYRRWPSKRHLVAYAVLSELGDDPAPDSGALSTDLKAVGRTLLGAFTGPLAPALAALVADMAHEPVLAVTIRTEVLAARRRSMREAFARARRRREIRDHLDVELILDMLTGPFYYRALFGHAPIDPRMARNLVDYVLRAVVPPARRAP